MQRRRDKTPPPPQMISSFVRVCFVNLFHYRIKLSFIFYSSVYRYTIYTRRRLAGVRHCLINGYTSETESKRSAISIDFLGLQFTELTNIYSRHYNIPHRQCEFVSLFHQ